jgi:hypothetical protein
MRADLMFAPRLRRNPRQREAAASRDRLEPSHRRLPLPFTHHRAFDRHRTLIIVAEPLIHNHRAREVARQNRQIRFPITPLLRGHL